MHTRLAGLMLLGILLATANTPVTAQSRIEVITLQHRNAESLANAVQAIASEQSQISFNANKIIIRAPETEIPGLLLLVEELDMPYRRVRISIRLSPPSQGNSQSRHYGTTDARQYDSHTVAEGETLHLLKTESGPTLVAALSHNTRGTPQAEDRVKQGLVLRETLKTGSELQLTAVRVQEHSTLLQISTWQLEETGDYGSHRRIQQRFSVEVQGRHWVPLIPTPENCEIYASPKGTKREAGQPCPTNSRLFGSSSAQSETVYIRVEPVEDVPAHIKDGPTPE